MTVSFRGVEKQIRTTLDIYRWRTAETEARAWVDALPMETPSPRITVIESWPKP